MHSGIDLLLRCIDSAGATQRLVGRLGRHFVLGRISFYATFVFAVSIVLGFFSFTLSNIPSLDYVLCHTRHHAGVDLAFFFFFKRLEAFFV